MPKQSAILQLCDVQDLQVSSLTSQTSQKLTACDKHTGELCQRKWEGECLLACIPTRTPPAHVFRGAFFYPVEAKSMKIKEICPLPISPPGSQDFTQFCL